MLTCSTKRVECSAELLNPFCLGHAVLDNVAESSNDRLKGGFFGPPLQEPCYRTNYPQGGMPKRLREIPEA